MKIIPNWTENHVQKDNAFVYFFLLFSRQCVAFCDLAMSCMAFSGIVCPFIVFYVHFMVLYAFYGLAWRWMCKYWFYSACIVFSRGHRSKFIWSCYAYSLFQWEESFGLIVNIAIKNLFWDSGRSFVKVFF